ncbi:sodium:solute symporter [Spongiivirga citrea]|uniref:Sodium:solute symporter n=1 Tax=Spongiivirga citrea TaxID=1481457 RepID=A0A6M0CNL5_9FLAO|nr:sodium:solute symporter [Spongiivirga citrea]NER17449.1 sodium:solute symporter [Spongiivirga citrea]
MHIIDWSVLIVILLGIVLYGVWKSRNAKTTESYLKGDHNLKWWTIGLSVMATQASAITFLSTPGQAYDDGMRFAQFYFGLPLAMIILCIFFLPLYYKLNVYTAYEFLENRFNLKTRSLTAILFLIQRGLAAGITIYAPAIILSTILEWNLNITILIIGVIVIFYTVSGGTNAVSQTQKQQMIVILSGMVVAFVVLLNKLPEHIGFGDAVDVAGNLGKLNIVSFNFDLSDRYNIWTAMLGGTFLFLSYFGTDQSQVQRYLSGKSLTESRLGLLFNGVFKVPMQFLILFVGVMVFMFYQFNDAPLHFNAANVADVKQTEMADEYAVLEQRLVDNNEVKRQAIDQFITENKSGQASEAVVASMNAAVDAEKALRNEAKTLIEKAAIANDMEMDAEDTDYVFITFITEHLPIGLIGLLLAVIFSAAMSSTASELSALATTSVIDIYKRSFVQDKKDSFYLGASKVFTLIWGCIALAFAMFASLFDNLIEAVNIIGSIFYGSILGIFAVAFFLKWIKGNSVFIAAILAETIVIALFVLDKYGYIELAYLWLNLIGCALVMLFAAIFDGLETKKAPL